MVRDFKFGVFAVTLLCCAVGDGSASNTCPISTKMGVCATGTNAVVIHSITIDECCMKCSTNSSCVSWSLRGSPGQNGSFCVLKTSFTKYNNLNCTASGSKIPPQPPSPPKPPPPSPPPPGVDFHSMFKGGAVLQMGVETNVWGTASFVDNNVTLFFDSVQVGTAMVDKTNASSPKWRIRMPPHSKGYGHTLKVVSNTGASSTVNVSIGTVILCSGQSNMGMSVGFGAPHTIPPNGPNRTSFSADNGTAETAASGRYTGHIFLRNDNGPYSPPGYDSNHNNDIERLTNVVNSWTDVGPELLGGFSAVCWYTGKTVFETALQVEGEPTPTGLIVAAVGGSPIEYWIPPVDPTNVFKNPCETDLPQCDNTLNDSIFFTEYIEELLPYTISALVWDQAERDVKCPKSLHAYPCMQQYLKSSWQRVFNSSFVFVGIQLAGYTGPIINGTGNYGIPITSEMVYTMRMQQAAGCANDNECDVVPTYDFSCQAGMDGGCPYGSVHQPDKPEIGHRVGLQVYKLLQDHTNADLAVYPQPTRATAVQGRAQKSWNITVTFTGGQPPFYLKGTRNCTTCCNGALNNGHTVDFDVSNGIEWINSTNAVLFDGISLNPSVSFIISNTTKPPVVIRHTAASIWPQCALYNSDGLPALPFDFHIPQTSFVF